MTLHKYLPKVLNCHTSSDMKDGELHVEFTTAIIMRRKMLQQKRHYRCVEMVNLPEPESP